MRVPVKQAKPSKYRNIKTEHANVYGIKRVYDSKAEARFAAFLDGEVQHSRIRFYVPQVPFPLPGGARYVADFLVMRHVGFQVIDVKGKDTPMSKLKRKQVYEIYGIDVEIVAA